MMATTPGIYNTCLKSSPTRFRLDVTEVPYQLADDNVTRKPHFSQEVPVCASQGITYIRDGR